MKALGLALGSAIGSVLGLTLGLVVLAAPALAQTQTIAPADAKAHVGQTVTIEGPVGNVYTARSGMTFIDIGGRYPDNDFAAGDLWRRHREISQHQRARRQDRGRHRRGQSLPRQTGNHPEICRSGESEVRENLC
jgi:hypothetical protein